MTVTDDLAGTLRGYAGAHLLTAGDGPHPHAVPVTVRVAPDGLRIADAGRTSRANAERHGAVTLLWAPPRPGGYSLIVDGEAVLEPDALRVEPIRAVLHRPASAGTEPSGAGCAADCVEIPVRAGTHPG